MRSFASPVGKPSTELIVEALTSGAHTSRNRRIDGLFPNRIKIFEICLSAGRPDETGLAFEQFYFGVHHPGHQLRKSDFRLPSELGVSFCGVAPQVVNF